MAGRVVLVLLFFAISAAAQDKPKECAFGFRRVTIDATELVQKRWSELTINDAVYRGPLATSPQERAFPKPRAPYMVTPPTEDVCPYERAVEVFGAMRVSYTEVGSGKGGRKQIVVDDGVVYEQEVSNARQH